MNLQNKKGALSLTKFVIAILIFSFGVTGFWLLYAQMAEQYNITINESFSEPFNRTKDINVIATEAGDEFQSSQATVTTSEISFLGTGINALKTIFTSLSIGTSLITAVSDVLQIPQVVVTFFITVITVAIVFAIVAAVLKMADI